MNKQITPEEALEILQNIKYDITDFRDIIDDAVGRVGSSITSDEEIDKLSEFIEQQLRAKQPLTDDERKLIRQHYNSIGCSSISFHDKNIGWIAHFEKGSFCPDWVATERIVGIGHTQDEAERDAINQLKEVRK